MAGKAADKYLGDNRRLALAAAALTGLSSRALTPGQPWDPEHLAGQAVILADAVLKRLS